MYLWWVQKSKVYNIMCSTIVTVQQMYSYPTEDYCKLWIVDRTISREKNGWTSFLFSLLDCFPLKNKMFHSFLFKTQVQTHTEERKSCPTWRILIGWNISGRDEPIRNSQRHSFTYSLSLKINAILRVNMQINARCKITKIPLIFCDEWMIY